VKAVASIRIEWRVPWTRKLDCIDRVLGKIEEGALMAAQGRDGKLAWSGDILSVEPRIRFCVRSGRLFWSYHVNMRLRERGISRETVLGSVDSYELIESYPEDKYLPSHLV